ncbi:MAG TPA: transcriptional regulator [Hydrogenophaga sp.]|nr:transcriptional regulator [Gammaproteobacteria bacterium]OGA78156.1 MAG: transcriptional regulator [Burkholderiales bacterium GWE1_65_30]OGA94552.1 MAG: transcriptional regulator [Burkholderiales bacterium GWF1_66_17]OGB36077.1 MAG: transcriptional regulator [Burkholderiales bacterium RIFCSPLOWO2_02_FULL_66_35]PKO76749.1 MAG: transcriptional regulator [Betaproteobacteria bacterium HGW-Betaproteobacteria-15]HAX20592.1 transcriptional regulator [Hydrogenophaga sp.]
MHTEKRTLLTVFSEASLEPLLIRDMDRMAIRGYTFSDARGKGSRGVRDASWDESRNIRLEVICARAQAEALLAQLQERFYANYAMVAYLSEVEVLRPEKF